LVIDYFLFQYFLSKGLFFDNSIVKKSLNKVGEVFGIRILDIINGVESNYPLYAQGYKLTQGIIHENFVPQQSFREWMLNMYK
jgi:hypothetical protein